MNYINSKNDFRKLRIALALSQFASAFGMTALPIAAFDGSAVPVTAISAIALASAIALLTFALPIGVLIDRWRIKRILIGADAARAVGFIVIALFYSSGVLPLYSLIVCSAINSLSQVAFSSSSQVLVKKIVPEKEQSKAIAQIQSTMWAALVVAPGLAGLLAGLTGPFIMLLVNGVIFLLSMLAVALLSPDVGPKGTIARRSWINLTEGVAFIARRSIFRRMAIAWILFAGATAAMAPTAQLFTLDELQFSTLEYGLLMGVPSVFGFLGSTFSSIVSGRFGLERTFFWSSWLRTVPYFIYPFVNQHSSTLLLMISTFSIVLFLSSISNTSMSALRMQMTPEHLMGRISTAWMTAGTMAGPIAIPLVGAIMISAGPRSALFCIAVLVLCASIVLPRRFAFSQSRKIDSVIS